MKTTAIIALFAGGIIALGQDVAQTSEPYVTERGPHHRVWETYTKVLDENQESNIITNSYTELETGMHYWDNGQWVESSEVIEPFEKGAIARKGQHQVVFSPQFNVAGVIDLLTADGQRVRGTPVGLAYHDDATGKSVLFATLKDSSGELLPPNQVIYSDCFSNVLADVRYTYSKAGFEQDIILRENPPSPKEFGLDPATTRLEVWTEFQESSDPKVEGRTLWQTPSSSGRKNATPEVFDEELSFGTMRTGPGKAFAVEKDKMDGTELIPVIKHWQKSDGRTFLVESVWFSGVQASLEALPMATEGKEGAFLNPQPKDRLELPAAHSQLAKYTPMPVARPEVQAFYQRSVPKNSGQSIKTLASNVNKDVNKTSSQGFVLDYTLLAGATNFTFRGDITYYVTNLVYLRGVTTIEGGTVVKYSSDTNASVYFADTPVFLSSAYRPAIFTAIDDDTVGETISGSTGNPTLWGYGGKMLAFDLGSTNFSASNLKICFARQGIYSHYYGITLSHSQLVKCRLGISGEFACYRLYNLLFLQNSNALNGTTYTNICVNLTLMDCAQTAAEIYSGTSRLFMTNCLTVRETNATTVTSTKYSCPSRTYADGIVQTVGAGSCYLASNEFRGIGDTNIGASLLSELRNKTTYAPLSYTNNILIDTILQPAIPRNTGAMDIGYHYDPIDYAFSGIIISNAVLTLTNGVAIAGYGSMAIDLKSGSKIVSTGKPTNLNRLSFYNVVQELPQQWGCSNSTVSLMNLDSTYSILPSIYFRFTDLSVLSANAAKRHIVNLHAYSMVTNLSFVDSQIRGGYLYFLPYYADNRTMTFSVTNSMVERCAWSLTQGYYNSTAAFAASFWNNTFLFGSLTLVNSVNTAAWNVYDNLFDQTTLTSSGTYSPNNGYNGYYGTTALTSGGTILSSRPAYNVGPLGTYYLPSVSSLINAGSRYATNAGLKYYTVLTNQTIEGSTKVDIGLHYISISNISPLDSDTDGVADYIEDYNGNGYLDSGESSPVLSDTDNDGLTDYYEYAHGTDPNKSDTDNDGVNDFQERILYTDPLNADTDGDGVNDGAEVTAGTDPRTTARIGYWKFNNSALTGEQGQVPIATNGVIVTNSFDGNAVMLPFNSGAVLRYKEKESNGKANIFPKNMSVRFMFRPSWTQGINYTNEMRLWEFGNPDLPTGGMSLSLDPYGTNLIFKCRDAEGHEFVATSKDYNPNTASPVTLSQNSWNDITVSISKESTNHDYGVTVWVWWQMKISNAIPAQCLFPFPSASVRSNGFCIGSSWDGTNATKQAGGCFDEVETYNYDMGDVGAHMMNFALSAEPSSDKSYLILKWRRAPSQAIELKRSDGTNIVTVLSSSTARSYADTTVQAGVKYTYTISQPGNTNIENSIIAGISIPQIEYRGRILLLIDNTLASSVTTEIAQLKQDLIGDGWAVMETNAPRHSTWGWYPANFTNATYMSNCVWVKNVVSNAYKLSNDLKTVFIIGHVTIPYSGDTAEDGHSDVHNGAWPADGFYGDVDMIWPDIITNTTSNSMCANRPGDGKYDNNSFPETPKVSVGRIDFDWIYDNSYTSASALEIQLIKRYLNKEHRYRNGQTVLPNRCIVGAYFTGLKYFESENLLYESVNNMCSLFGFESGGIISGDMANDKFPCQWGYLGGDGGDGIVQGNAYHHLNAEMLLTNEIPVNFYTLAGSFVPEWNGGINNLMRGILVNTNYGLISTWVRGSKWRFGSLAQGYTTGEALLDTIKNSSTPLSCRTTFLMGDPTLRLFITTPVTNLTASRNGSVTLNWNGSGSSKYLVWATTNTSYSSFADFKKLTLTPVSTTSYVDTATTNKVYMIRAINVQSTMSGTFTNISQAVIISVP
jgi:hypothetical protein